MDERGVAMYSMSGAVPGLGRVGCFKGILYHMRGVLGKPITGCCG